jgi:hypothetical protein
MMIAGIWPKKTWGSALRFLLLLTFLGIVIAGSLELQNIGKGGEAFLKASLSLVGSRFFEGFVGQPKSNQPKQTELNAVYGLSLLKQLSISETSQKFAEDRGVMPASITDLAKYGLNLADAVDPWGRPYRIRLLNGNLIVVQSTGPSGTDAISSGIARSLLTKEVQLVGDNLIVTRDLTTALGRVH